MDRKFAARGPITKGGYRWKFCVKMTLHEVWCCCQKFLFVSADFWTSSLRIEDWRRQCANYRLVADLYVCLPPHTSNKMPAIFPVSADILKANNLFSHVDIAKFVYIHCYLIVESILNKSRLVINITANKHVKNFDRELPEIDLFGKHLAYNLKYFLMPWTTEYLPHMMLDDGWVNICSIAIMRSADQVQYLE